MPITLKEKVDNVFQAIIKRHDIPTYKEIYNHKVLYPKQQDSIFMSLRVYNKHNVYFIISMLIQLKDEYPVVKQSVYKLEQSRFFLEGGTTKAVILEDKYKLSNTLKVPTVREFLSNNGMIHASFLMEQYDIHKETLLNLINQIEEEKQ